MFGHKRKMILIVLVLLGVFSALTMLIWNTVLTAALGVASISFWQALGLLVLCRILFGGPGLGFRGFAHRHRADHWHKMDPEQRRELLERFGGFHERFHGRFGGHHRRCGHGEHRHPHGDGRHGKPEDGSRCCGRPKPCGEPADAKNNEEAE